MKNSCEELWKVEKRAWAATLPQEGAFPAPRVSLASPCPQSQPCVWALDEVTCPTAAPPPHPTPHPPVHSHLCLAHKCILHIYLAPSHTNLAHSHLTHTSYKLALTLTSCTSVPRPLPGLLSGLSSTPPRQKPDREMKDLFFPANFLFGMSWDSAEGQRKLICSNQSTISNEARAADFTVASRVTTKQIRKRDVTVEQLPFASACGNKSRSKTPGSSPG